MDEWTKLLQRSFGGEDVAAAPSVSVDPFWPTAPPAANADVVCDRLVESASTEVLGKTREWVFLVGSAGNGKSSLAMQVGDQVAGKPMDVADTLARRIYSYQLNNGAILQIINDATIPPSTPSDASSKAYLYEDLVTALNDERFLLVCVNRGILLNERRALVGQENEGVGSGVKCVGELISFLLGQEDSFSELDTGSNGDCSYYKFVKLSNGQGITCNVHVLYLDQVSLFEEAVKHGNGVDSPWSEVGSLRPGDYSLGSFPDSTGHWREKSPANLLATLLVDRLPEPILKAGIPSPVSANLAFFESQTCRTGWLNVMRGVEIRASSLLTYREVWGLLVVGLVGFNRGDFRVLEPNGNPQGPLAWFSDRCLKVPKDNKKKLVHLVELALTRVHMSSFGYDLPRIKLFRELESSAPPASPAVQLVMGVDPVRDVRPEAEMLGKVNDALRAITLEEKPSVHLKNLESSHAFCDAWQPFDDCLEDAVLEFILTRDLDADSRAMQAWYGRYLYRLYALASGIPAFSDVISTLVKNWGRAHDNYGLDPALQAGIEALINVQHLSMQAGGSPSITLPFLSPKATPIDDETSDAYLALRVPVHLHFVPRTHGDQIVLTIKTQDIEVSEMVLDFDLCREALVHSGLGGFTERSHLSMPRIERVRASLLSEKVIRVMGGIPGQKPEPIAVKGDVDVTLV